MKTVQIYHLITLAKEDGSGNILEPKSASRHHLKLAAQAFERKGPWSHSQGAIRPEVKHGRQAQRWDQTVGRYEAVKSTLA